MKVYSWKTLVITVLGCALVGWIAIGRIHDNDIFYGIFWLGWTVYMAFQGLRASLTKAGYEKDQSNARRSDKVHRELFGRFAPVAPYGAPLLILLSGLLLYLFPFSQVVALLPLGLAVAYAIWYGVTIRKRLEDEKLSEALKKDDMTK